MDKSNVCPTEDAMQVFMDYLVEPLLPSKYSDRNTPSLDKQKAVANQVQAVVLLYNYYHRKIHPQLEYLGFEQFCKLALILKPNLKSHMKFMLRPDDTELSDLEKQLSLTEKVIKDACDISTSLDASSNDPISKGWLVSKVAVLLIDSSKEKCFLQNGSITWGVWSVIEKDVNEFCWNSDGSTEVKHMNKRRRVPNKHLQNELGADEGCFQQFAFSVVKEAIHDGFSESDLTIVESHVVFSLSKGKTTTRFYIMQFVGEKEIAHWIPIKDVIDRLQGPLCEVRDSELENLIRLEGQNVANNNVPSCLDGLPADNPELVIHESDTKDPPILQNTVSSKEHILSETALRFLLSKRDKLVLQQRAIGDEIAQCDKRIQTILSGGEDELDLKIDLIIEGCNDVYFKSASQGWTIHDYEGQCSNSNIERNRFSDEAIGKQNPCQELDHICKEKNWILPTYQVYSLDGGYQAKVDVKGLNFEASTMGAACPKPSEARGSAAAQMLAKLLLRFLCMESRGHTATSTVT